MAFEVSAAHQLTRLPERTLGAPRHDHARRRRGAAPERHLHIAGCLLLEARRRFPSEHLLQVGKPSPAAPAALRLGPGRSSSSVVVAGDVAVFLESDTAVNLEKHLVELS